MAVVRAIAINTFKEAIRDRILYLLVFFSLLMIVASVVISTLSVGQNARIIADMGLAAISLFSIIIAVFIGTNLLFKEIDKRTIISLLSKPIRRRDFILGKYLGLIFTLMVLDVIMSGIFIAILFLFQKIWYPPILWVILLMFLEVMVVTASAIFFSTITSPLLSALFTFSLYGIGHYTRDLMTLGLLSKNPALEWITAAFYYILPNLENFNLKNQLAGGITVAPGSLVLVIVYGLFYVFFMLVLSILFFQKKEF